MVRALGKAPNPAMASKIAKEKDLKAEPKPPVPGELYYRGLGRNKGRLKVKYYVLREEQLNMHSTTSN